MDITTEIARADYDYRAARARQERHPAPRRQAHRVLRVRRPQHAERVA